MRYLLNTAQMKRADHYTTEHRGVSSLTLMERAAGKCVEYMEENNLDVSHVCVVCGTGNNGGDGLAMARMLAGKGHRITAVLIGDETRCTQETREQIRLFKETGGKISNCLEAGEYSIVADALFGVGLSRNVEGNFAEVIQTMNNLGGFKLAVDLPSGIAADTGCMMGIAFQADATVTFQAEKLGMELYPGKEYVGKVCVADIGIDLAPVQEDGDAAYTCDEEDYLKMMPRRLEDSNKGTYGRALIIAGSKGMSGAAYLNAKAAYMTGAGLVQIYTAEENRVILQTLLPEAIVTTYDFYDEMELIRLVKGADTISIGSGIGTGDKAKKILKTVLEYTQCPCVVDADALNLLAEHRKYLENTGQKKLIFTPHMKEMSRITGLPIQELKEKRMEILHQFAEEHGGTWVLKDARTVSMTGGEQPYVNLSGNAAMAKAGAGDVLAGVIAGLLAQGMDTHQAGILGVYLHGRAGDLAREEKGSYSVMARDLADYIGKTMKEQERGSL